MIVVLDTSSTNPTANVLLANLKSLGVEAVIIQIKTTSLLTAVTVHKDTTLTQQPILVKAVVINTRDVITALKVQIK